MTAASGQAQPGTGLAGRVAVVTGAASGIGRAVALQFAAAGASVFATDRDGAGLDETARLAEGEVRPVVGDLLSPAFPQELLERAGGRVDVLANVAGLFDNFAPLEGVDDDLWDRILGVNLTAPMRLCRAFVPGMVEAGGGCIVTVASLAGLVGGTSGPAYTASKHGVVGLTKNLAALYGGKGIRCNAVCPAGVSTNLFTNAVGTTPPWVYERLGPISLGKAARMAEPDEIAALVTFLCSPAAVNINGSAISTDSGWSAT